MLLGGAEKCLKQTIVRLIFYAAFITLLLSRYLYVSILQMKALLDDREKAFRTLILECLLKRSDLSGRNLLTSVYIVIGMVHVRT